MTRPDTLAALQKLQAERLQQTYHDFLSDPEYAEVAGFFFGEVYSGEDTSERDRAYSKFYQKIRRVLGGEVGRCMGTIQDLQHLTLRLDRELAEQLDREQAMGENGELDMQTYERAYAREDHRVARQEQIQMLVETLELAYIIFHRPGIGTGLRALHQFQKMRRDTIVSSFLMRAYETIHPLRTIEPLVTAIAEREQQRLNRILQTYSSSP